MEKKKLIRITTVPISFAALLRHQMHFMRDHYDVVAISSPSHELKEIEEREQVPTFAINMTRKITPIKDLQALLALYKFFKSNRPHFVHTHTPKAGLLGMMAAKLAGVPIRIHTVAGLPLLEQKGLKRTLLNTIEKLAYSCAHYVYPNSNQLKKIIIEQQFAPSEKVRVIGNGSSNGINTQYFSKVNITIEEADQLKQQLGFSDQDFVFCFVGRIVGQKGINELVNAFLQLKQKYNNIKLLLVGPYETELDPILVSTDEAIKNHIDIRWIDYQLDIRPYLNIGNVFVYPSYREGFPNGPMQAGAMELPCIVSDINGCNEIIIHKKNGLIVPAKDVKSLFESMELLMTNKELYHRISAICRQMIVSRFDQQYHWQQILNEYQLLEKKLLKNI